MHKAIEKIRFDVPGQEAIAKAFVLGMPLTCTVINALSQPPVQHQAEKYYP